MESGCRIGGAVNRWGFRVCVVTLAFGASVGGGRVGGGRGSVGRGCAC